MKTLSNANIYIDSTSWLGSSKEITLPEVTAITDEYEALGFYGTLEAFLGVEPLVLEIVWIDVDPKLYAKFCNFGTSVQLQVRGHVQQNDARSQLDRGYAAIWTMTARSKMVSLGEISKAEIMEIGTEWAVDRVKAEINNREVFEFDVTSNIYNVNGQDMLRQYRRSLGLAV